MPSWLSLPFLLSLTPRITHTLGVKKQPILRDEPQPNPMVLPQGWTWQVWPAPECSLNTNPRPLAQPSITFISDAELPSSSPGLKSWGKRWTQLKSWTSCTSWYFKKMLNFKKIQFPQQLDGIFAYHQCLGTEPSECSWLPKDPVRCHQPGWQQWWHWAPTLTSPPQAHEFTRKFPPQPGDHRYLVLAQASGLYTLTVLLRSFYVVTRLFVLCECLWGNQFPYELWKLIPTGL